jgi:indolepyruvate ferredoxin oxidoreductase beta subunit
MAAIIAAAASEEGLNVKQGEVHGMAQRGGAVQASLRLSDGPIHSDLIPKGTADLILSMEPLESLRYVDHLSPQGTLLTSADPVRNIPDYPDLDDLLSQLRARPRTILIEADKLARTAGSALATNVVMVGAAAHFLPMSSPTLVAYLRKMFARKGEKVVDINVRAFGAGEKAGRCGES